MTTTNDSVSRTCPICAGAAVRTCRCRLGDSLCAEGHSWHYCGVHRTQVLGDGHGAGASFNHCTCHLNEDACCHCGSIVCIANCPLREPYERTINAIKEGVVSITDFNAMFEALDKSTKERVLRRTRESKVTPGTRRDFGRVVPKIAGHDDPPHQGRGRRFASGRVAKERQNLDQARRKRRQLQPTPETTPDPLNQDVLDSAIESRYRTALDFLVENHGKVLKEHSISKQTLVEARALAARMMRDRRLRTVLENKIGNTVSNDWLYTIVRAADTVLGDAQSFLRLEGLPEAPCQACDGLVVVGRAKPIGYDPKSIFKH